MRKLGSIKKERDSVKLTSTLAKSKIFDDDQYFKIKDNIHKMKVQFIMNGLKRKLVEMALHEYKKLQVKVRISKILSETCIKHYKEF